MNRPRSMPRHRPTSRSRLPNRVSQSRRRLREQVPRRLHQPLDGEWWCDHVCSQQHSTVLNSIQLNHCVVHLRSGRSAEDAGSDTIADLKCSDFAIEIRLEPVLTGRWHTGTQGGDDVGHHSFPEEPAKPRAPRLWVNADQVALHRPTATHRMSSNPADFLAMLRQPAIIANYRS